MVYRIILVCEEADNFRREIKINTSDTFADLHGAIMDCCGYSNKEMSSFVMCDEDWRKGVEITPIPMKGESDSDEYIMDETHLDELIEEEGQQMLFVFDMMSERSFFMKVVEIIPRESLDKPVCVFLQGEAPKQLSSFELDAMQVTTVAKGSSASSVYDLNDDSLYGEDGYNEDELINFDEITADVDDLL
ncbi:MAG: hypothetical protein SPI72_06850 [Porphyromonas sp.]|nr:hypothetical protein [Porphyromonas sp.]